MAMNADLVVCMISKNQAFCIRKPTIIGLPAKAINENNNSCAAKSNPNTNALLPKVLRGRTKLGKNAIKNNSTFS